MVDIEGSMNSSEQITKFGDFQDIKWKILVGSVS